MAWSLATLSFAPAPLQHALASSAIPRISCLGHQDISNIAWACAKIGYRHHPLLESIAAAASPRIPASFTSGGSQKLAHCAPSTFVPQDLANTVWAYAVLCVKHGPLLEAIAGAALPRISSFNPQNLANSAWSFEELSFLDQPLLHAISASAMRIIGEFDVQPLATLADRGDCLPHAPFF